MDSEKTSSPINVLNPNGGFLSSTEGMASQTTMIETPETTGLKDTNSEKYHNLVSHIEGRFSKYKTRREQDESRWSMCYANFRGEYGQDVQFTSKEKSQAFIKITKTKVLAAYNQVIDVLFAGGKFPIGVEASPYVEGIPEAVHIESQDPIGDMQKQSGQQPQGGQTPSTVARKSIFEGLGGKLKELLDPVKDKVKEGPGLTPTSATWYPAMDAAKKMDKLFHDQLAEAHAEKSLRLTAFEMALFGHGVYKGPFLVTKVYPKWSADGTYAPETRRIPQFEHVSIWDCYPDPDARTVEECVDFIQRHKMSRSDLRNLMKREHFNKAAIEEAIEGGFNYHREDWEDKLNDYRANDTIERYEVIEFWGAVDAEFKEFTDIAIPKEYKDMPEVQINAWVCNGKLLRLVFNPFTPARIPYHAAPYELNPYSFFGIGVAENMEDTQMLMNGFMRMAVDNAALSSNLMLEVNETQLKQGQTMDVFPGKIFVTEGQIGQSIHSIKLDNVTQETFMMFDKARQLADEATGIPSYSHGQGGVQGIGRTAAGMSMLMGAAAQNIKAVVRNIDDYLLVPLGKALFAFNMQFNFDKDMTQGDLEVVARGTESLMRNEVRSQKLLQFLQVTANPMDAPFTKRDYLLRELADSLDLESDRCINDPRQAMLQAMQMKELMQAQGMDPMSGQTQSQQKDPLPTGDPTGNGGGNIGGSKAPTPQEEGFSGSVETPPQ